MLRDWHFRINSFRLFSLRPLPFSTILGKQITRSNSSRTNFIKPQLNWKPQSSNPINYLKNYSSEARLTNRPKNHIKILYKSSQKNMNNKSQKKSPSSTPKINPFRILTKSLKTKIQKFII